MLSQFIKANSLVFDVGANVGNKTQQFLELGARVVAFEPVESCVLALLERFKGDKRVEIVPCAVGAKCGEGDIEMGSTPNLSTLAPEWKRAVSLTKRFGGVRVGPEAACGYHHAGLLDRKIRHAGLHQD